MKVEVRDSHSHVWPGLSPLLYVVLFSLIGVSLSFITYIHNAPVVSLEESSQPKVLGRSFSVTTHSELPLLPDVAITSIQPGVSAPVISRIPTAQRVVFLGIDDGWFHVPEASHWFSQARIPVSFFLTHDAVRGDIQYFKNLQSSGLNIQNHTISHPHLPALTRDQQKIEICGASDQIVANYGTRPTLFRPPYGQYNDDTLAVVMECGMKAVVMWRAYIDDGVIHYQDDATGLVSGDIVLMHLRANFAQDMTAFMNEANKQGLTISNLENWLR